jgi:hypothetical protein
MEGRWAEIPLHPLVFQAEGLTGAAAMQGQGDGDRGPEQPGDGQAAQPATAGAAQS